MGKIFDFPEGPKKFKRFEKRPSRASKIDFKATRYLKNRFRKRVPFGIPFWNPFRTHFARKIWFFGKGQEFSDVSVAVISKILWVFVQNPRKDDSGTASGL